MAISGIPAINYTMQSQTIPAIYPINVLILGQSNVSGATGMFSGLENQSINYLNSTFGANQNITTGLRAVLAKYNTQTVTPNLYAYVKADAVSSTATQKTITLTGTSTSAGNMIIYLGSSVDVNKVELTISFATGTTVTAMATAIAAAVNAEAKSTFSATSSAGVVTLTAVNAGSCGNYQEINVQILFTGTSATVAQTVAGATNPDFSSLVTDATFLTTKFDYIVILGDCGFSAIETALATRSTSIQQNKCYDGQLLVAAPDIDFATGSSTIAAETQYEPRANGLNITAIFNQKLTNTPSSYTGDLIFATPYELACECAAIQAINLTIGATTSGLVIQQPARPALIQLPIANTSINDGSKVFYPQYNPNQGAINAMQGYQFSTIVIDQANNPICNNFYTLSNDAVYASYETKLTFYTIRNFIIQYTYPAFQQKNWTYGTVVDQNTINESLAISIVMSAWDVLAGTNTTSIYSNYYAGLVSNSDAERQQVLDVLKQSIKFDLIPQSGGAPLGQLSYTLRIAINNQITNINIIQQNILTGL